MVAVVMIAFVRVRRMLKLKSLKMLGNATRIFWGSKRYAQGKDWSKMVFKVFFLNLMAFPTQINVRPKTLSRISI